MKLYEFFRFYRYNLDFTNVVKTKCHEVQYAIYLDHDKKRIWLAFEKSNGSLDWFDNLTAFITKNSIPVYNDQVSEMKCHKGFRDAYKSAKDIIMAKLLVCIAENPDYEIFITGWSHGGALSALACEDLNFRTRKDQHDPSTGIKATVITFGAPRVFSDTKSIEYVRSCAKSIIEVSNANDVVSRVPLGFKRLTDCGYIGKKANFFKFFNPWLFHTSYGDEKIYANATNAGIDVEI